MKKIRKNPSYNFLSKNVNVLIQTNKNNLTELDALKLRQKQQNYRSYGMTVVSPALKIRKRKKATNEKDYMY